MQYEVTARTKQHNFLAYQFRINLDDLQSDRLYNELIKDERYTVKLLPVTNFLAVERDKSSSLSVGRV